MLSKSAKKESTRTHSSSFSHFIYLFQLQRLKLLDGLLESPLLGLEIRQLLLLDLLQLGADLLLVARVGEDLLLALDALVGLVELLARLLDLAVDVDAALDVQEDGGGSGHGEHHASWRPRVGGGEDRNGGDTLAGEGLDGLDL